MRNLLSITLMTFLLTIVACSKDDDGLKQQKGQLELSASALETEVGETVSFEVTANGTTVTDALIYVNGNLDGQSTSFNEKGNYSIVAKKEGFLDSEPLNLSVYLNEVYVAGFESNGSKLVAKLWKNGVAQNLTDGSNNANANSVYVSDNDVYVAEVEFNGSNNLAKLWKNGTAQNLTDGSNNADALSVSIHDNDVYVAGSENHPSGTGTVAKLWKNGEAQDLSNGPGYAVCHSVFVSSPTSSGQADVYVAGRELNSTNKWVAKLWKNGVGQDLTDGTSDAYAKSVYVLENNVYVVGHERYGSTNIAKLWINGVAQDLTDGTSDANAKSIYVTRSSISPGQVDVYVAGYQESGSVPVARLWKNGQVQDIGSSSNSISYAKSVYVSGNDVYVAGSEFNGSTLVAKLWKNGVEQNLTDGSNNADAESVFVVKSYE